MTRRLDDLLLALVLALGIIGLIGDLLGVYHPGHAQRGRFVELRGPVQP